MINLVNLTEHDVVIYGDDSILATVPPSGTVARVSTTETLVGYVEGVPVYRREFGQIVGLPDYRPGVFYIVSSLVLGAARSLGRTDLLAPNSGKGAVRDGNGRIIGVRSFVC